MYLKSHFFLLFGSPMNANNALEEVLQTIRKEHEPTKLPVYNSHIKARQCNHDKEGRLIKVGQAHEGKPGS